MRVTIMPGRETREVEARDVGEMLRKLGLHQDAYLVVRGEDTHTRDVRLRGDEELDVIPDISGGLT